MAEPNDILGKDLGGKKEEETQAEKDLKALNETLGSLKSSIEAVNTRLDEHDARLSEVKTPEEEKKEEEEHFAPKTWDEIPQKAQEIAEAVVEKTFEEKEAEQKAQEEEKAQQAKQIDTFIDKQVETLEGSGKLPKIENPNDENDKGRAARRELFGLAARVGTMDLEKAQEVVEVLHKSGYTYDPKAEEGKGGFLRSGATPSGAGAPVSSSSRSTGFSTGKPTYQELHQARSLEEIARKVIPE